MRPWSWWSNQNVRRGTFSAIGVPGRPQEEVQHVAADQNQAGTGSISGSLVRDNEGEYGFVPPPRPLSTEAAGSDALRNVVEIAGRRFVQALPAGGRGGFQVVVADPDTLQGKSYWFETSACPAGRDVQDAAGPRCAAQERQLGGPSRSPSRPWSWSRAGASHASRAAAARSPGRGSRTRSSSSAALAARFSAWWIRHFLMTTRSRRTRLWAAPPARPRPGRRRPAPARQPGSGRTEARSRGPPRGGQLITAMRRRLR